ncbi:MAG: DUF2721 domain-containing protein [Bacteroides sp.]|nr:DUF2721 domain-containing protein [Bacteroides sp.]
MDYHRLYPSVVIPTEFYRSVTDSSKPVIKELYGRINPYYTDFLFSAVSLILLAYTNRFLSYAQLVRTLKDQYKQNHSAVAAAQIKNLWKRLYLTRTMQFLGISSLFLCVVTMFLIYIGFSTLSVYLFGLALLFLIASLGVSIVEIHISVKALELHLNDMEK